MKKNTINQDEFVERWAKRARFAKKDVEILLDALIEELAKCVLNGEEVMIRNFGKLHTQQIGERKGRGGRIFPPTTRTTFKLGKNIRNANKKKKDS